MSKETEPGTLPEGIEKLRREFVALTAREWPKTITPEVLLRLLDRLALDVAQTAYAEGAAQERARSSGCIACGEQNQGGYEVEDGPGPFCAECWERLEACFATRTPPPPEAQE